VLKATNWYRRVNNFFLTICGRARSTFKDSAMFMRCAGKYLSSRVGVRSPHAHSFNRCLTMLTGGPIGVTPLDRAIITSGKQMAVFIASLGAASVWVSHCVGASARNIIGCTSKSWRSPFIVSKFFIYGTPSTIASYIRHPLRFIHTLRGHIMRGKFLNHVAFQPSVFDRGSACAIH
jgi:hypothetical protein